MKVEPILKESFYHDGRGPELQTVHFAYRGKTLVAIDYFNPDDEHSPDNLKHLVFIRSQVFMFTPEEIHNSTSMPVRWKEVGNASALVLHESSWLSSFNRSHLQHCKHYQLMFYDEFLDVICEDVEARLGGYSSL